MELITEIKEIFSNTPFNIDKIRELLSRREFTKEELAKLAIDFTDRCFCEYLDALRPECTSVTIDNMCSNHIVEALDLLLEFGLDPNVSIDDDNVMWNTMWIDAPGVAAASLKLLLENGGNPNHTTQKDPETLFEYIDFKVSYDEYEHKYFHTVQCWLLLMAYGASWNENGDIPLVMLGGNTVDIFKNYELYDYEIEPLPQIPGKFGCWIMHIYNVETGEKVAQYR